MSEAARLAAADRRGAPARRAAERWLAARLDRGRLLRMLGARSAELLLLVAALLLLAIALDRALGLTGDEGPWAWPLVAAVLLGALRLVCSVAAESSASRLGIELVGRLRRDLLERAMDATWRLQVPTGPGGLARRMGPELESIAPWAGRYLPAAWVALVQPVAILVVVVTMDWVAAVVLAICAPIIPAFMVLIGKGTAILAERQHARLARIGDLFLDRVAALPTLRLFAAAHRGATDVADAAETWRRDSMGLLRVAFLSSAVLEFFGAIAIATLAIYVGLALLGFIEFGPAQAMTPGAGLAILVLAPEFFAPLRRLGQCYHDRGSALGAAVGLRALLESAPASTRRSGQRIDAIPSTTMAPLVECQGLVLQWPGASAPVTSGLDLRVDPGEWLVVSGPSGCGKSTLAAALAGLLVPAHGVIAIDGRAPSEVAATAIGWLEQAPRLLPGSLAYNIAPGDVHAPRARLQAAIDTAGLGPILDVIPGGLHARLGDDGLGLSGGEAQRIALARAVYPCPRLLVLDEPTASLDRAAARALLRRIRALAGTRTVIMMSHDPDAIAMADRHWPWPTPAVPG